MKHPDKAYLSRHRARAATCRYADIAPIFERWHYKGRKIGGGITMCFALLIDGKISGGAVLGKPRHNRKYAGHIDIRRLACTDEAPCNSESWFLGQIIRWIAANTPYKHVLSYSDATEQHTGGIYKACNFRAVGQTAPTKNVVWQGRKYHPRSLTVDRAYSRRLRADLEQGLAYIETGKPKTVWVYDIPPRQQHKQHRLTSLTSIEQA